MKLLVLSLQFVVLLGQPVNLHLLFILLGLMFRFQLSHLSVQLIYFFLVPLGRVGNQLHVLLSLLKCFPFSSDFCHFVFSHLFDISFHSLSLRVKFSLVCLRFPYQLIIFAFHSLDTVIVSVKLLHGFVELLHLLVH